MLEMQKKDEWFDTDLDRDGSQCHIYLGDTPTLVLYEASYWTERSIFSSARTIVFTTRWDTNNLYIWFSISLINASS